MCKYLKLNKKISCGHAPVIGRKKFRPFYVMCDHMVFNIGLISLHIYDKSLAMAKFLEFHFKSSSWLFLYPIHAFVYWTTWPQSRSYITSLLSFFGSATQVAHIKVLVWLKENNLQFPSLYRPGQLSLAVDQNHW